MENLWIYLLLTGIVWLVIGTVIVTAIFSSEQTVVMKKGIHIFLPGNEVLHFCVGEQGTYNGNTAVVENISTYDDVVKIVFDDRSNIKIVGRPFEYYEEKEVKLQVSQET